MFPIFDGVERDSNSCSVILPKETRLWVRWIGMIRRISPIGRISFENTSSVRVCFFLSLEVPMSARACWIIEYSIEAMAFSWDSKGFEAPILYSAIASWIYS